MTLAAPKEQTRTCCGCRESAHQDDLERFVLADEMGLLFDMRRKAPGPEVWVHPDRGCLRGAVQHRGFERMLDRDVPSMDYDEVVRQVVDGLHRRLVELLTDAVRARAARIGAAETVDAFKREGVGLVLIGSDAGDSTTRKFETMARANDVPAYRALNCSELADVVGSTRVAVLGITEAPHIERVGRTIEKLQTLEAL